MPSIVDRFADVLSSFGRGAQRIADAVRPPPRTQPSNNPAVVAPGVQIPGVPHWSPGMGNRSADITAALRTVEAYFGRVSFDAGPSPTRYSSYPATDLTPEKIIAAQQEAASGWPLRWEEMIEQVLSRDSHLAGIAQQRIDDVMKGSWRLVRATNDDIAACLRNFCDEAVRGTDDLEDGFSWLLWANAYCYNAVEITWKRERVTFPGPSGEVIGPVEVIVPARLDAVHSKHFRFDLRTDEPYLWLGSDQVSLPYGKFIFLKGEGQHPITERRGYMWQCVWLSMFKSIGWAGWATYVDRFGLPTPLLLYEGGLEVYESQKQALNDIANNLGQGKPAIMPQEGVKVDQLKFEGGRASDPFSAISDACESGQSVRVLGATLTAKIGNVGSFSATQGHLEVKYAKEAADARRLWAANRSQMIRPIVRFNAQALAAVISEALGTPVTADMLMRRVPVGLHRVPKEIDPVQRANVVDLAINKWGMKIGSEALYDEFDLPQPLSDGDVLPGQAVQVSAGGASVGSIEAAHKGVRVPSPQELTAGATKNDDEADDTAGNGD